MLRNRRSAFLLSKRGVTYYKILEVSPDASTKQIREAYLSLSKKFHPDSKKSHEHSDTSSKFSEINEAYRVLANKKEREAYDKKVLRKSDLDTDSDLNMQNFKASIDYKNPLRSESYKSPYNSTKVNLKPNKSWLDYYKPYSGKKVQKCVQEKLDKNDPFWTEYNSFSHDAGGSCIVNEKNKTYGNEKEQYASERFINYILPISSLITLTTLLFIVALK